MAWHFSVLGSGSAGNACLLEADGYGLLVDAGLGPRQLAGRMRALGASWPQVSAALLSHTHTDHWNDRTLAYLQRLRIPLYCHAEHHPDLLACSTAFAALRAAGLVRPYELDVPLCLAPGLFCRPFPVRHDGGLTCGFRFDGPEGTPGGRPGLGYATDLGSWCPRVARLLTDVDVLAVEFNHDVVLERSSGRSPRLIARVLGDHGHLSNDQAAALVRHVLDLSEPGRLRHVVQMHLSRDCNRPGLARQALADLADVVLQVHTARQDEPGPRLAVGEPGAAPAFFQPSLPGWEE
jgi:phosphoribosyl 1,2-cyclic phosphodiesterase